MRVLVVEDEALIAQLIEDVLIEAGYEVLGPVSSVAEALELAREEPVDLALLDVNLGLGGDGVDLAHRLHERQGLPCLFASASAREALRACDVALGLLRKPFGPKELVLAVEAASAVLAGAKPARVPRGMDLFAHAQRLLARPAA